MSMNVYLGKKLPKHPLQYTGFSLIEMMMVILVLGVLSALIVPRMVDLSDSAHSATAQSVSGSFSSGIQMVHAAWLTQGKPSFVAVNAGTIAVSSNGYPGSDTLSQVNCSQAWRDVLDGQPVQAGVTIGQPGWGTDVVGANCRFIYQPDDSPNRRIDYNPGTGVVTFSENTGGGGAIDALFFILLLLSLGIRFKQEHKAS